ncbi:MAG: ATP-binding cassette domain-containing protein [Fervidicoccaceae archaeon]
MNKLVEVEGLEVNYTGADPIISGINFDLYKGELLFVMGRTGAGKTTLLNAIVGNIPRLIKGNVNGKIFIKGKDPRKVGSDELLNVLGLVPQEPWNGIIGPTVEDEIMLSKMLSEFEFENNELTKFFDLDAFYERTTFTLSAGEVQKLAILSRIILNVDVLILDEPLTYLDKKSREELKKIVKFLLDAEKIIIVTGHEKGFWDEMAKKTIELMGREDGEWVKKLAAMKVEKLNEKPHVEVKDLEYKYYPSRNPIFEDFNLSLDGGGVFLIKGPNGSGKTTLLRLLAGLAKPKRGKIYLSHRPLFLPDNPLLFFSRPTVLEELQPLLENSEVGKTNIINKRIKDLSSGERRLTSLLAASLLKKPILLMDEPTVGLDAEYKALAKEFFRKLGDSGRMLLISTHDPSLDNIADDVIEISPSREK